MKSEKNKLDQIKKYIKQIKQGNEIHLEETAYLVKELGGFGPGGGFSLGISYFKSGKPLWRNKEYEELALFDSIQEFWRDAGECYIRGRFRACAVLLACLTEAVICLELLRKGKSYPKKASLGQLINYCEQKKVLLEILSDIKFINELRKIAIHLIYEKTKPKEIIQSEIFDELVPVEKFRNPPANIGNIVYKYKKLAQQMYIHVQSILKILYGSKFKFKFRRLNKG